MRTAAVMSLIMVRCQAGSMSENLRSSGPRYVRLFVPCGSGLSDDKHITKQTQKS